MKKISILLLLCGAIFFTACKEKTIAQEVHVLTPQEFKDSIDNNPKIQLLDVRTPEEFAEGHLVDAENINVMESEFLTKVEKLDPEKPVYLYCRSGRRSAKASALLKEAGFKEIYDLQGGFLEWESNGYKAEN